MAEERIKGIDNGKAGKQQPRDADAAARKDELSREELESVAGGAAFTEERKKIG